MKEFEDFAKAISIGMKALAKMIETAADQLQDRVKFETEKDKAQETRTSRAKKAEAGRNVKKEKTGVRKRSKKKGARQTPGASSSEKIPAAGDRKETIPENSTAAGPLAESAFKAETENTPPRITNTASVLMHIQAAGESITIDELQKKTGFEKKKLHNIIHRLKSTGKIRNTEKAVYTAQ